MTTQQTPRHNQQQPPCVLDSAITKASLSGRTITPRRATRQGIHGAVLAALACILVGATTCWSEGRDSPRATTVDGAIARDIALTKARLLIQENKFQAARQSYQEILADNPTDDQALAGLASIELAIGRPLQAHNLLSLISETTLQKYENLMRHVDQSLEPRHNTSIAFSHIQGLSRQVRGHLESEALLTRNATQLTSLHLYGDVLSATLDPFERSDGSIRSFKGERARGGIAWSTRFGEDSLFKLGVLSSDDAAGGIMEFRETDTAGAFVISGEWNSPFWDFLQSLADGGARSSVSLRREHLFDGGIRSTVGLSARQYSLNGTSAALSTVAINGSITVPLTNNFFIQYLLDGEYGDAKHKISPDGRVITPLPFANREFHVVDLGTDHLVSESITFGGYAGYGFNRLGNGFPHAGVRSTIAITETVSVVFTAEQSVSRIAEKNKQGQNALISIQWRG